MTKKPVRLVLAVGLLTATAPAEAGAVNACVSVMTWTFSPPLTTSFTTGVVRLEHTSICTAAAGGGTPTFWGTSGADIATFTGSCALALISSTHYDATVLASAGIVQLYQNPPAAGGITVTVGTSDAPCAVERLSGLGAGTIAYP